MVVENLSGPVSLPAVRAIILLVFALLVVDGSYPSSARDSPCSLIKQINHINRLVNSHSCGDQIFEVQNQSVMRIQ